MTASGVPVLFLHGLWLHASSWDPWLELFGKLGFDPTAPGWPREPATVAEARRHPEAVAGFGIDEVTRHYQHVIDQLAVRPILIGHSFGGMIAEKLLAEGYGSAAIAIDAAQIKGVLPLPLSALRATLPVFKDPANRERAVSLTPEEFRYSFGNAVSARESDALFERWTVPSPGKPLFEAAEANFARHSPAAVQTGNDDRGPLLLITGGRDHTVPEAVTKATLRQYRHSRAVTDLVELADRGHSLTIDSGWREVAETCLNWLAVQGLLPADHGSRPSMMALRAHARGGPEVLVYEPAPRPAPAADEALVEVHAAAITFAELGWAETWQRDGRDRTPTVPSHEVSGVVAAVGGDVHDLAVGDEVYGLIRFDRDGAAADLVAVPAADLAAKPASVPHTAAAAVPLAALTAWQAWRDHAALQAGEHVLVHGGAGGVGAFAVQLAHVFGAHVTATARSADRALVQRLGAERVLDFEREEFDADGPVYDVVLDTVGGATLDRSFGVLKPGGRLVTLQAPPSPARATEAGVTATFFVVTPDRDQLTELARLVDDGALEVLVAATYPLAAGRAAFESAARPSRSPGKTVLVVRPD